MIQPVLINGGWRSQQGWREISQVPSTVTRGGKTTSVGTPPHRHGTADHLHDLNRGSAEFIFTLRLPNG